MRDLRKTKDEAMEAVSQGHWRKAMTCYVMLEKDEPAEGGWSLKVGECQRKLGHPAEAIRAFERAVETYSREKLLLKAVAVCKMILELDPRHTESQAKLAALHASQTSNLASNSTPQSDSTPHSRAPAPTLTELHPSLETLPTFPDPFPAGTAKAQVTPPPLLQQLQISDLLPGAKQSAELLAIGSAHIVEIPLDVSESFSELPAQSAAPGSRTLASMVLPKTPFFTVLNETHLRMAIDRVSLVKLAAGEILFSQGDHGDALYVVVSGEMVMCVPQAVACLGEGDFFGEIAVLAGGRRTATAQATVETQVLAFDRLLLADLMAESPALLSLLLGSVRDRLLSTLVETSPLLAPFTPLERMALATRFQFLEAPKHARLVEEGTRSPGLFILMAGEAAVVSGQVPIARLAPGDVFGEMSLVLSQPSLATVVCLEKSYILFLPRNAFAELIMTHPQVLEYVGQLTDSRLQAIGRLRLV